MSPPGDYFLNWSKHQANRTLAFNAFRDNQQFADVTLACDDDMSAGSNQESNGEADLPG